MKTGIIVLIIVVLALEARLLSFCGYYGSDDSAYADMAYLMANGKFQINAGYTHVPVFPLRVGLMAPVALCFKVAGVSEFTMLAYPFLVSLLSVVLAFFAGCLFFNTRAGLIAAAIQALLPIDARSATMLLPDLPAAFWANLGIVLIYYGSRRIGHWPQAVWGIFAGLALGASWLHKESMVYLLPLGMIILFWSACCRRKNVVVLVTASAVFFTVLFTESLIYYCSTGDFLYRLHETERNYEVCKIYFFTEGSTYGWERGYYWSAIAERLFKEGPVQIFLTKTYGWITPAAMLALGYALLRRWRRFVFPGLWFLFLVLVFNFGSSSLTAYRPLVLFERYLYPILFPAVLLNGGLIASLVKSQGDNQGEIFRERRFWGCMVSLAIIYICTAGIVKNVKDGPQCKIERKISQELSVEDEIFTDYRTENALNFFWKYPSQTKIREFSGLDVTDISPGAYVFINRDKVNTLNKLHNYKLPSFYHQIPENWQVKMSMEQKILYWVPLNLR